MQSSFKKKAIPLAIAASLFAVSGVVHADAESVDQQIELLREQMEALSLRLNELEASNRTLRQENAELLAEQTAQAEQLDSVTTEVDDALAEAMESVEAVSWAERIDISGDFRYRYEDIALEGRDDRTRSRIRARAALVAQVQDDLEVGIAVASGGESPVSANQTLGGSGTTKNLGLDQAYFNWSGLENTEIIGGKFKNTVSPVGKNSWLWDSDWRPEGASVTWDNGTFYVNTVGTWLEGDSRRGDEFAWIAEAGFQTHFGDNGSFRAGIGAHRFGVSGRSSFFGDGDFFGNSTLTTGDGDQISTVYRYDYEGIQAFAELGWRLFDLPATAYVDYVQNQDADEYDTGYILGLKLGNASAMGTWDLGLTYQDLEADAAYGLLVDSNFGNGGTDATGWILRGGYALTDSVKASFRYFKNEVDANLGTERDYERLIFDLAFKF